MADKGGTMVRVQILWVTAVAFSVVAPRSGLQAAPAHTIDIAATDVAGVRLGMSPVEARAALDANSWNVSDDEMQPSFKARVAEEAGKYTNTPMVKARVASQTIAEGPDYQKIVVEYQADEDGPHVSTIRYSRPAASGKLLPSVIAKYGEPTVRGLVMQFWCAEAKNCPSQSARLSNPSVLALYDSYGGRSELDLFQGVARDNEYQRAFAKAVKDLAPNYGKASF